MLRKEFFILGANPISFAKSIEFSPVVPNCKVLSWERGCNSYSIMLGGGRNK